MELKFAQLLHNPEAGEGELSEDQLTILIEEAGFKCSYSSTKKNDWEKLKEQKIDFIVLAGGDGTVRKVADKLLDKKIIDKKYPLALLPLGTANNIAKTLGITGSASAIIDRWHKHTIKKYDIGKIVDFKKANFFVESIGFGVLAELMKIHNRKNDKNEKQKESLKGALLDLLNLIRSQKAKYGKIIADDRLWENEFLLLEVMNTSFIGPNLQLAPFANPGDGELDIVMITNQQRKNLEEYITRKLSGLEVHDFTAVRAKKVSIEWEGNLMHVDDELIKIEKKEKIDIELIEGALEFLV